VFREALIFAQVRAGSRGMFHRSFQDRVSRFVRPRPARPTEGLKVTGQGYKSV